MERQDEREHELREDADKLEERGDELEERSERLDEQIDDAREEFERKKESSEAPGLQDDDQPMGAPPGDAAGGAPRTDDD